MKKVVVTGANGHLGYSTAKMLAEDGYQVRATVRGMQDPEKTAGLKKLDVELVEADLQEPASLERAFAGMDGLFQIAAAFNLTAADPEREVIRPNEEGTRHAIEAAHRAGIKKVVYTSSIAAVGTIRPGEAPLDESHWNDGAVEPYAISKNRSEKIAWEIAKQRSLNLVTILPGTMVGPDFRRPTASLQLIRDLLDGKIPMALPLALSYTDVRDVARAHILAYESDKAAGRYIATTETLSMAEVCRIIKAIRPGTRVSDKVMPAALARLIPYLDALQHKITGAPRQMTKAAMREYLNREQSYNSVRLQQELNWSPRPVRESFKETIEWMERLRE